MLDIQYLRDHPDVVRQAAEQKQLDPAVVDRVLDTDEQRRLLIGRIEELRRQSNRQAGDVKRHVQGGGQPSEEQLATGKKLKGQLKELEPQLRRAEDELRRLMLQVPNVPAEDVPVGPDETGNQVIRTVGQLPQFEFAPRPHHQVMEQLDLLDTKRAVKIAGFRAYFLKNDGLLLEQALLKLALDMMIGSGFTPLSAPVMVNLEALVGTGYFPWGEHDHYRTQDGTYLTGTSEVALTSYHAGETLAEKDLPIKLCGLSPCFRREVGTHGQDTQGIVRVHQFNKVEQVVYTRADETETRSWHETMLGLSERLLELLELPYQVLVMCTGDMGAGQRKKYDIETWFPSQQKYRETHSASYFNDFQSRRLNIRYQAKDGSLKHVYTLNNTMAATPRLLAALVENHQQLDGSINLPAALRPLMGKASIGPKAR
ncbi:MAG: serine--tRNA ligase [Candidatus Pacebacteria bacterium CG10_big_fil_rev_8_21_14_0_10_56_10]|nr:MAG: serine--tRNA ligase [Candidatus Pacebacteria bacterium CG10_big_fil_rev_8_21_14_0_10_56_10]